MVHYVLCLLRSEAEISSSTKRDIRHFHVVAVEWRQRSVQKLLFGQSKPISFFAVLVAVTVVVA